MSERHDNAAELHLLGACLESKTARLEARKHLTSGDFYQPDHEALWDAMSRLDRHQKPVDIATMGATVERRLMLTLAEIMSIGGIPDNVPHYAAIIRGWSIKRQVESAARQVLHECENPMLNASGFSSAVASRFQSIRDSGIGADEVTAMTATELLDQADDEPEWLIPGLLERRDRLMLTGEEGLGKSHLLRQLAILGAAGLNPFNDGPNFEPLRTLVIDCENTWSQVRRKIRPAIEWASRHGRNPSDQMMIDCTSRMDITRDKDISRIHQLLDAWQPDIVAIGPLYRLVPRALQTDDDTAPVLAALDTIRDRGCALLMEAHAGHAVGKAGVRDLRPRGSSSLLGWPEFGFGMRSIGTEGYADLVPWRGQREERAWPTRLKKADGYRWLPNENLYAYNGAAS